MSKDSIHSSHSLTVLIQCSHCLRCHLGLHRPGQQESRRTTVERRAYPTPFHHIPRACLLTCLVAGKVVAWSGEQSRLSADGVLVQLNFKDSPFFTIIEPLSPMLECIPRETTRDEVNCSIQLSARIADQLTADPNRRVMIYSASDPVSHFAKSDISFPHQIEIKINEDEVKAYYRGLKNKPGTTRPADITSYMRRKRERPTDFKADYANQFKVTWALTPKAGISIKSTFAPLHSCIPLCPHPRFACLPYITGLWGVC